MLLFQLLIQPHKGVNSQFFRLLCQCLKILFGAPQGKPGGVGGIFNGVMTVQLLIPMTAFRDLTQRKGKDGAALLCQRDGFRVHGQIQPKLPPLPGGGMFFQMDMMGTGGEEYRAIQSFRVFFGDGDGAGEGGNQMC